ncbi:hypothetical protein [Coleofasciculus sp. H7-2]|uniref:hypothetical protein n=1 Tax=Coleofasciculus sp. H7-2 TaxID=3351545 RepID=UPI0036731348
MLLTHPVPPLRPVVLVARAGTATVGIAKIVVLRCLDAVVFKAIATSATFPFYLQGTLGSDALLVQQ